VRYEAEDDITPHATPGSEQETCVKTAAPELDALSEEQRRCHAVIRLMEDAIRSREKALLILVPSGGSVTPQTKQRPLHERTDLGRLAFVSRPLTDQLLAREDLADLDIKTARHVDMSGLVAPRDILRRPPRLSRQIPSNGYEYSYSSDYESSQSGKYSYYSNSAHSEGYYTYDTGEMYEDEMLKTSMLFRKSQRYAGSQPEGTPPPSAKSAWDSYRDNIALLQGGASNSPGLDKAELAEAVTELADTKLTGLAGTEPVAAAGTMPVVAADDKSSSASSFYDEPAAAADTAPVAAAVDESSYYDEYGYTYDDSPAWQMERMVAAATGQM